MQKISKIGSEDATQIVAVPVTLPDDDACCGGFLPPMPGLLMRCARHLATTVSAALTGLDAIVHPANLLTALGARFADFRADAANPLMEPSAARHEVRRRLANLGAVHHQPEVFGLDVLTAHRQTVRHRHLQAGTVALLACLDTFFHRLIGHRLVNHDLYLHKHVTRGGFGGRPSLQASRSLLGARLTLRCLVLRQPLVELFNLFLL